MKIERILCPIDFPFEGDIAVQHATSLARRYQSELHFLFVYEPVFADGYLEGMPVQPQTVDLDDFRDQLKAVVPKSTTLNCRFEAVYGFPAISIVDYAASQNVDLIVMGTRGLTGISHLLLGSVAECVLRRASCPVLTVHRRAPAKVAAKESAPQGVVPSPAM